MLKVKQLFLYSSLAFLCFISSVQGHLIHVYAGAYMDEKEEAILTKKLATGIKSWEDSQKIPPYERQKTPVLNKQTFHVSLAQGKGNEKEVLTFLRGLLDVFPNDGRLEYTVGPQAWPKTTWVSKDEWVGVRLTLPQNVGEFLDKWMPGAGDKWHISTHINLWGDWKMTQGFKKALVAGCQGLQTNSLLVRHTVSDMRLDVWVVASKEPDQGVRCLFYKKKDYTFERSGAVQFTRKEFAQKVDALLQQKVGSFVDLVKALFKDAKPYVFTTWLPPAL